MKSQGCLSKTPLFLLLGSSPMNAWEKKNLFSWNSEWWYEIQNMSLPGHTQGTLILLSHSIIIKFITLLRHQNNLQTDTCLLRPVMDLSRPCFIWLCSRRNVCTRSLLANTRSCTIWSHHKSALHYLIVNILYDGVLSVGAINIRQSEAMSDKVII